MNSNQNSLQLLPLEVLIKIFNYMDTYDLVQFCKVFKEYEYLLRDKQVIRDVNFARKSRNGFQEFKYFSRKMIHKYVTSLNINGLYWVPAADLRKIVVKLINLKSLLAVDTNLELTDNDITAYRATKLTKLALTLERIRCTGNSNLPLVKSLYVIIVKKSSISCSFFEKFFPGVVNLWIYLQDAGAGTTRLNFLNLKLNTFIAHTRVPRTNRKMSYMTRYFKKTAICWIKLGLECYENVPKLYDDNKIIIFGADEATQNAWKMLRKLNSEIMYSPKDTRRLYLGIAQPETILFEELNFVHESCGQRYLNACQQILQSSNISKLRKLAVMSCLFPAENSQKSESTPSNFKRRHVDSNAKVANSGKEQEYRNMFKHFPNLQELEVFFCDRWKPSFSHSINFIKDLRYLHSLTVEIPEFCDGEFLIDIAINCKQLVSLRIFSEHRNKKLNCNLQIALTHATALKDICLQSDRLQIEKLFSCFGSVVLERLALFFRKSDNEVNEAILHDFFRNHPNLEFMCIVVKTVDAAFIEAIERIAFTYVKKGSPQKFFAISGYIFNYQKYGVPHVHYREMMSFDSKICTLNFYNDFNVLL